MGGLDGRVKMRPQFRHQCLIIGHLLAGYSQNFDIWR
jgi:hypothetical protein